MAGVDVVIPCYNYAHFLPACVESVLSQEVAPLRITIIDNASSDDSVQVARQLGREHSSIEVICHETNIGSHGSFNEGVDRACADYFIILCADDLLTPGCLQVAIDYLERHSEASFAIGAYDGPVIGDVVKASRAQAQSARLISSKAFIDTCCRTVGLEVAAHALLVRTSVQKAVGHYKPSIPQLDDLEMALRLARHGAVVQLSAPLAVRRLHASNISGAMWDNRLLDLQERLAVFDSFFLAPGAAVPRAGKLHGVARRRLGAWAYWSALSHFARGKYSPGMDLMRFAARHHPLSILVPPVDHLFRTEGSVSRLTAVLSEALGRRN